MENFQEYVNVYDRMINEDGVEELIKKYKDNPYGLGAGTIEVTKKYVILRFGNSLDREQTIPKLKKMKINVKDITKRKGPEAWKYRFELSIKRK